MRERKAWVGKRSEPPGGITLTDSLYDGGVDFDSSGLAQQFHGQHQPAEILFPNQNSFYPLQGSGFDPNSVATIDEWAWFNAGASINRLANTVNFQRRNHHGQAGTADKTMDTRCPHNLQMTLQPFLNKHVAGK